MIYVNYSSGISRKHLRKAEEQFVMNILVTDLPRPLKANVMMRTIAVELDRNQNETFKKVSNKQESEK